MFSFFFNDTATTEIYTLSLHDALPISVTSHTIWFHRPFRTDAWFLLRQRSPLLAHGRSFGRGDILTEEDRKSTRLNSSHANISYAVFCLIKKALTWWDSSQFVG